MAKRLYALSFVLCLSAALAGRVPRQAASTQFTNSSVTTKPLIDPSASGAFCCQAYAIHGSLNWWYTDTTAQAIQETIVTQYLKYNNTVIPTATITVTDSSAAKILTTIIPPEIGPNYAVPGIPLTLNGPQDPLGYYLTVVLTETEMDFGYTTV